MFCLRDLVKFNKRRYGLNPSLILIYRNNKRDGFYLKGCRLHWRAQDPDVCIITLLPQGWLTDKRKLQTCSLKTGESKSAIGHQQSFRGWVWEIFWLCPSQTHFPFLKKYHITLSTSAPSLDFCPLKRAELLTPATAELLLSLQWNSLISKYANTSR